MSQFKYEAKFADGSVESRGSDREYTHAAMHRNSWAGGTNIWVTFHGTEAAARKSKMVTEVVRVTEVKASKKAAANTIPGDVSAAVERAAREAAFNRPFNPTNW